MQIYNDWEELSKNINSSITLVIGNFDGIHLGHQELINIAKSLKSKTTQVALLTFTPHSAEFFTNKTVFRLTTKDEMRTILRKFKIPYWLDMPFTKNIANLNPEEFIILLQKHMKISNIVVGFNFRFGKGAKGNVETLADLAKKYIFKLHIVPPVYLGDEEIKISSTYIRSLVSKGNIELANKALGRAYFLRGQVIHGKKRGRKLGFPTANIRVDNNKLIPEDGVYAGIVNGCYNAAINIGYNPSFNNAERTIEVYIIDYNGEDIYGETIVVELTNFIRGEIKFDSLNSLIKQVHKDILSIRTINPANTVYKTNS